MNAWHLPQPSANARPRTELGGFSAKAFQLRIAAFSGMECFPLEHFLPGLFVVGVMDLDDVRHVLLFDVLVLPAPALAQHGIPEHLLAGILPEFAGAILGDFRDGRCLPVGRQWEGLIRCGLLICSWHLSVENGSALAEYIFKSYSSMLPYSTDWSHLCRDPTGIQTWQPPPVSPSGASDIPEVDFREVFRFCDEVSWPRRLQQPDELFPRPGVPQPIRYFPYCRPKKNKSPLINKTTIGLCKQIDEVGEMGNNVILIIYDR